MREPACVGALIKNAEGRVFVQRRSASRGFLPGVWDIVGGHIEDGETPLETLAREIEEETWWWLRRVVTQIADWEWEHRGVVRRELDFIVEVDGDLSRPRLEPGKHDAYEWIGVDNLHLMREGRSEGDTRLSEIVERAIRFHSPGDAKGM